MSTPTPRTDAKTWTETNRANEVVTADFARTLERELASEKAKVRTLRDACESICEEWGANYSSWPIGAGNNMERRATAALAATEGPQ